MESERQKAAASLVSPTHACCCCLTDLLGEAENITLPPLSLAKPLAMNYGAATITANCLDEKQALLHLPLCISLCLNSRFRIVVSDQLCGSGQSR